MRLKLLLLPMLLGASVASTQASTPGLPAPVLFFSDLTSGPATGNSDPTYTSNGGAYVTLYGNFLGTSPTVALNGVSCLTTVSQPATWLWYQRMIVEIGATCTSGNFVVTTSNGTSNSIPFTVANGHIYYVSTTGNDSGTGSFQAPWGTPQHAKITMTDGDITYLENGVISTTLDPDGNLGIITPTTASCASTTSVQRAMGGYPGATATLGSTSFSGSAIKYDNGGCNGYTFFGLTIRTGTSNAIFTGAFQVGFNANIRYVALDVSCPNGNGATACVGDGGTSVSGAVRQLTLYGNNIHDVGAGGNRLYHAVYHGTTFSIRDGWNSIYNVNGGCRGIQIFASTSGFIHTDVHIHDNLIHDTGCNAIGMYDTDPSVTGVYGGGAEIFNNVIYNIGSTAPSIASCIYYSEDGNPVGGTVQIYNNTLYNCESTAGFSMNNFDATPHITVHLYNNIIYQLNASVPYFTEASGLSSLVTGDNNLVFGIGSSTPGCVCNGTVSLDPGFVSASGANFHLSASTSPANGAGSTGPAVPTYDPDGLVRPSPPSIGAYEFAAGAVVIKPNPPTNLKAVVL